MPALLLYLFKASLVFTLLFGVYWVLLRQMTFCQLNRLVLLGIIGCSLWLPGLQVPLPGKTVKLGHQVLDWSMSTSWQKPPVRDARLPLQSSPSVKFQSKERPLINAQAASRTLPVPTTWAIPLEKGLLALYLLGSSFLVGKLLLELLSVLRLAKTGSRQRMNSCTVIYTDKCQAPLSFFKLIILHPKRYTASQLEQIIRHEQVHAQQWHSLDVLLVELFTALFWFHPLVYLLSREVKLNLEYLADGQVLLKGADRKAYQYHLLDMSTPSAPLPAVTYFNFSYLKSRIHRMNMPPSTHRALWRYGSLLPVIILLLLAIEPMNAARHAPAGTPSAPVASATRGVTTPVQRKTSTVAAPSIRQAITTQEVGQGLNRIHTTPAQSTGREATPAKPVAHAQPSDTTAIGESAGRVNLLPMAEAETNEPALIEQGNTESSNTPPLVTQTTTASALAPYLKLEANQNIYLAVRASLSENDLEGIAKHLREIGLQVEFTNLRYNQEHQLTRIQMRIRIGDCASGQACFDQTMEAYNQGAPLQDNKPLVFYLSRRIDKVGISYGYPKELVGNDLGALLHITGSMIGNYGG